MSEFYTVQFRDITMGGVVILVTVKASEEQAAVFAGQLLKDAGYATNLLTLEDVQYSHSHEDKKDGQ